ncbi:hypothetical protein GGU11DRAFT_751883, partial [Lentinula aff. detonsa]
MSISEQSTRDNEVSRPVDYEKVVATQPPLRPRSPTEPGQIRENPFVENESSPSSNGITVRSSLLANYAARKLEKSTVLGTGPTVVRNNHDKEGNPPRKGGISLPLQLTIKKTIQTPDRRTQALIRLIESQENEAQETLDQSLKEVRSQQIEYLNKRFQAIREWVEDNPNSDEPVEVQTTSGDHGERKKVAIEENGDNDIEVTEENDPGVSTVDNEGFNINTSAKPSTRHVYPNGKTFDEMLNDPRFVNIPGSTRNIGEKLEWADRVVGQMMRAHSMRDGQCSSVWHEQGIKFDSEGNPYHRGTAAGLDEIRQHPTQQEYGNNTVPNPRIPQGTLVATGDHYP